MKMSAQLEEEDLRRDSEELERFLQQLTLPDSPLSGCRQQEVVVRKPPRKKHRQQQQQRQHQVVVEHQVQKCSGSEQGDAASRQEVEQKSANKKYVYDSYGVRYEVLPHQSVFNSGEKAVPKKPYRPSYDPYRDSSRSAAVGAREDLVTRTPNWLKERVAKMAEEEEEARHQDEVPMKRFPAASKASWTDHAVKPSLSTSAMNSTMTKSTTKPLFDLSIVRLSTLEELKKRRLLRRSRSEFGIAAFSTEPDSKDKGMRKNQGKFYALSFIIAIKSQALNLSFLLYTYVFYNFETPPRTEIIVFVVLVVTLA